MIFSFYHFLGSLSNDNDDDSEHVAKNWIFVLSNFIASIWTRSICRMKAIFSWSWILKDFILVKNRCSRPPETLHWEVVQWTSNRCTKKVKKAWCTCSAVSSVSFDVVVIIVDALSCHSTDDSPFPSVQSKVFSFCSCGWSVSIL